MKITDRKLDALVTAAFNSLGLVEHRKYPGSETYSYTRPNGMLWFTHRSRMGGAVHRMIDELQSYGYLTLYRHRDPFTDQHSNDLTVKGFDALIENYGRLKSEPVEPGRMTLKDHLPLHLLQEARAKRAEVEAAQEAARAKAQQDRQEKAQRYAEEARAKTIARFRQLFRDYGMTDRNWEDDEVLKFAEQAGDAIHL